MDKRKELVKAGSNEVEFLVFHLGGQKYGINVAKVRQIMVFDPSVLSAVPNQLPEYLGLMPFREQTVAVVDLGMHLRKEKKLEETPELLVITEFNRRVVAFVVNSVDRIERCSWEAFQPMSDSACNADIANTVGIVRLKDQVILILDLETIMGRIDPSMALGVSEDISKQGLIDRSTVSILHCDDSVVVQKVLIKTLEAAGYRNFVTFPSAVEALNFLKSGKKKVDVILSDIEMPKMDGLAFCKKVKEDVDLSEIPLLFFSSTVDPQMYTKCLSVGAEGAFSKPEVALVVESIDHAVKERRDRH